MKSAIEEEDLYDPGTNMDGIKAMTSWAPLVRLSDVEYPNLRFLNLKGASTTFSPLNSNSFPALEVSSFRKRINSWTTRKRELDEVIVFLRKSGGHLRKSGWYRLHQEDIVWRSIRMMSSALLRMPLPNSLIIGSQFFDDLYTQLASSTSMLGPNSNHSFRQLESMAEASNESTSAW